MAAKLITVLGPTAVGKTRLAVHIAGKFNGEIISADSRQVYKGMDIGTGKDIEEYFFDGQPIQYHLIDIAEPDQEYNLFSFRKDFETAFNKIISKNKMPILAGGTGLYLSAVLQNYSLKKVNFDSARKTQLESLCIDELNKILLSLNPNLHNSTDLLHKDRIVKAIIISESDNIPEKMNVDFDSLVIGIIKPRVELKKNITKRLKHRLENGMIEEVEKLINKGISSEKLNFFGLEYRFVSQYINGELNYNDMFQKLNSAIHSFAKRQMTWFRKMEKEGVKINWIRTEEIEDAYKMVDKFLSANA
ncbi:MAG: tRNA (adenosine(37)-N6)-dimethylallyltransferase MiaA [Melioribacteraceae bacterium]|nr:tRNA (adenosine(37)-N6)-dimethylallyltransferase MiaA [Melioribacteraceae bacterium]MDD3558347.1 tRNA (adenosine(37)-N6)-dimethylallyltransferase MiaA [Melioribacteraceae bacterium]